MSDQNSISIADLARLSYEGGLKPDEAVIKAQKLGLDHYKLAILLDVEVEQPQSREESEAKQPPTWRVTAHGFPKADARGKPYPFIWAGRHSWTRDSTGSSTHELTDGQWRDMERKVRKGVIAVTSKSRITDPKQEAKSQPKASK